MNDKKTTIEEIKKAAEKFMEDRDWKQFHTPKDDAIIKTCLKNNSSS